MAEQTQTNNQMPTKKELDLSQEFATKQTAPTGTTLGDIKEQVKSEERPEPTTMLERPGARNEALEQANLAKLQSSGELANVTDPTLVQNKINMATYGVEEPIFGATDSSTAADTSINNTMKEVGGQLEATKQELAKLETPEYRLYTDYEQEVRDKRAESKETYQRLMDNINADFSIRKSEQQTENRLTTGGASKQLARMNAFGRAGSAIDYMQKVERTNQEKINKLLVQKEQLLIQATMAYEQQDWDKLKTIMSENKLIVDQYNQVQKWKFEDSIMSNDQIIKQTKFGWDAEDRAMEKISTLAGTTDSLNDIPEYERRALEEQAGLPFGFFDSVYEYNQKTREMEETGREIEEDVALFSLLAKIPEGQTVELNGRFYTGIAQPDTIKKNTRSYVITDKNENQSVVTVDENGALLNNIALGPQGLNTPSSYDDIGLKTITSRIEGTFKDGDVGGQCGEFVHAIVADYPYALNTYEEKAAQVNPYIGMGDDQFPPQVGDVVIQDIIREDGTRFPPGHVSIIREIDYASGVMKLTESNWNNDERITTWRTLNSNDASVTGFYRGRLQSKFVQGLQEVEEVEVEVEVDTKTERDFLKLRDNLKDDILAGKIDADEAHSRLYQRYQDYFDNRTAPYDNYSGQDLVYDLLNE